MVSRRRVSGVGCWGKGRIVYLALCLVLLLPCLLTPSSAGSRYAVTFESNRQDWKHNPRTVLVLIVANCLVLDDLDDPSLTNIARLFRTGSSALISPNCPRPHTENSVILTASIGTPCTGGSFLKDFFDYGERVPGSTVRSQDEYRARTGLVPDAGQPVFLGLGPAQRVTGPNGLPIPFGLIGDSLQRVGKRACVIGNADQGDESPNRAVAAIAADSQGLLYHGGLNWSFLKRGSKLSIDTSGLLDAIRVETHWCDLIVVNYGPSTQLDEMKLDIAEEAYATYRSNMLHELDEFVGGLVALRRSTPNMKIALVSLSPSQNEPWNRLTPIVIDTGEKQHGGLLTSATTRTPGLISATDIASTLLASLDVRPVHKTVGSAARTVSGSSDQLAVLHNMDRRVADNCVLLIPLLVSFAAVGGLALSAAAVLFALRKPISRRVSLALRFGMLYASCSGLATMLAVLAPAGAASYAVASVGIGLLLSGAALLAARLLRLRAPLLLTFGATALVVVLDALTGGHLIRFSVTSSDQLDGFRYYGIGNEYGSALICMTALVALFSAPRYRILIAALLGAAVVMVLGAGSLGANYGATAAAVVTFVLILVALRRGGYQAIHVFGSVVAGVLVAGGFAYLDWLLAGSASTHGARLIGGFGLGSVTEVAWRKLSMNLRIAGQGSSVRIFLAFVPFMALWFYGVQPRVKQMIEDDKRLIAGLKALLVGAVAALLLNDSGVLMAAFMVAMTVLVLVYSLVELPDRQLHSQSSMAAGGNAGGCEGGAESCQG